MAYPPTLASLNLAANFRGKMLKALALLLSSFESEQDARVAGQAVYMSSGPGAPTANIGTNVRGVYFREDASDTDAFIYLTVNGSTWVAIETLADLDHLIPGASTEKTISDGVITATGLLHTVDTETDAASDDLDTISGLADGELCLLYLENAARNVVVKHGTGNISGPRAQDVTLDAAGDMVMVERKGSVVYVIAFHLAAGLPTSASGTASTGTPSAGDTGSKTTGISAAGADTGDTGPAFTGGSPTRAEDAYTFGTGFATVGQVVTTSDNQTLALNECAGMWLITATQAPCIIDSHPACVAAPAVFTVFGLAPVTAAEGYRVMRAPVPDGTVASHHHAAGLITVNDPGHVHGPGLHTHAGPSHSHNA
jgi:hypothetical protein